VHVLYYDLQRFHPSNPVRAAYSFEATFTKTASSAKVWDSVTEEGKSFIRRMLTVAVDERYSVKEALEDPWIANNAASAVPFVRTGDDVLTGLQNFWKGNKLQKMARHIVAMNISDAHIVKLKDLFVAMDNNNDGTLTLEEIKNGIKECGVPEWEDMDATLLVVDSDGSGVINYTEFLAATLNTRQRTQEDACWAAFRHFDRDKNGSISKAELRETLKDLNGIELFATEAEVNRVLEEVDSNNDGVIQFDEFMDMMRQKMVPPEVQDTLKKTKSLVTDAGSLISQFSQSPSTPSSPRSP
jgi:calcium-dependent protein kinase